MTPRARIALSIGLGAVAVYLGEHMRKSGEHTNKLDELLPSFRPKIAQLLLLMRKDGFDPKIANAFRDKSQEAEKVASGVGIVDSMHGLRLAADIVDRRLGWNATAAFWDALDKHARALGLTRIMHTGPDGIKRLDLAHVQAIPVSLQNKFRAAKSDAEREAMLGKLYA